MFYDELKKQILDLITNNKFQEAYDLVNEELKVPYIPPDFEPFLRKTQKELQISLNKNGTNSQKVMNAEILFEKLNSVKLSEQVWAIMNLENLNLRPYLPNIEKYLLRIDAPGDFKTMLLITLYNQQIPNEIKIWKNYQTFTVIPSELKVDDLMLFLHQVKNNIEKYNWTKNMTYETLANKLAFIFIFSRFPKDFDFNENDIVATTYKKALELLGEKITWTELENHFSFDKQKALNLLGELNQDLEESMINE